MCPYTTGMVGNMELPTLPVMLVELSVKLEEEMAPALRGGSTLSLGNGA